MRSRVLLTLKAEWKVARATLALMAKLGASAVIAGSKLAMWQTMAKKGFSRMSTQTTPITFVVMWAKAARRACVLALRATMLEVIVVPMFSPSTSMTPWSMWSTPVEQSIIVMAMMAADD